MKIAYLLLVHNQPAQTARLINAIKTDNSIFFIHVDAKSDEELFRTALNHCSTENIFFIQNRISCHWGRFDLVEATLNLINEAFSYKENLDHYILLSGSDYLIKPAHQLEDFLQKNLGNNFLEYYELPSERINERQDGLYRINRYHYYQNGTHKEFPPFSKKPLLNPVFNSIAKAYQNTFRKMPLNMKLYAGSQWWILTNETIRQILQLLQQHKDIKEFFKNVWIPDEIFFQTIILHISQTDSNLINNNYRFISWEVQVKSKFINATKALTLQDFEALATTDAFFARKFDDSSSKELMEKIDAELLQQTIIK